MTPTLRPVEPADAALVQALAAARRPELAGLPEAILAMQAEAQRRDYESRYPANVDWIVEEAGRPVGRLWVQRAGDPWRILDVVLLPEHRGRGIGTALLEGFLADADDAGVSVLLTVEAAALAARRLYARLGFAELEPAGAGVLMQRPPRRAAGRRATG